MKSKINNHYLLIKLLIIFLGVVTLVFVNYIKNTKEKEYIKEKISNLSVLYDSSIDKYRVLTKYVLEETIQNELTLSLFERGVNSQGDIRRLYKGLLYKELEPTYIKLKKEGIRQLHFHLKNNESYIRFHKPNKYGDDLSEIRESVRFANKENRNISSFETGRVISGFRNVFPLNVDNKHLGSVEIGISTKTMINSIMKQDDRREYLFLLKKDIVFSKLFNSQNFLYKDSVINSKFLIEDIESSLLDSPRKLSDVAVKINKKISKNKKLKDAMKKGDKWGIFVKIDDIIYDVTFIPMLSVTEKIEGYLVEYKKSENIPTVVKMDMYIYLIIIFAISLLLGIIRIIEQKSKSLEKQKLRFQSITDGLGEGLYVMDLNAKITYVNPAACNILGYSAKEIVGKYAHSLFHTHAFNNNIKLKDCPIYSGVTKEGIFTSKKEYFLTSNGRSIPVSLISRIINKDNDLCEIITSFTDITIQKELEEKSSLLITALESSINCIVITDKEANIQWANKAFEGLTGFKLSEIIGKDPKEFISSQKQTKEFYSKMWKTILNKKPWRGELINKKKDGTLYDEELIITPVLNEYDEIINFIAVKQDITYRKLMLLEKEKTNKLFYQQSKMAAMGEMLENIAHQWRQPLSTMSTAATGTKFKKEMNILSDEEMIINMDIINNSAQYLSKTIDDFRNFFNPSNSIKSRFFLSKTIEKTLNLIHAQLIKKNIVIIKDIENISIFSIENELIQVLINLLNNSSDALLDTKKEKKLIFIKVYKKEKNIFIEIKDNGIGVSEEIIDRIFEPYFTTKHKSLGTGIGLYMCKEILRTHLNGNIYIKNVTYNYDEIKYSGALFTIKITED